MTRSALPFAALALAVFLVSCALPGKPPETPADALVRVAPSEYPGLTDNGPPASLAASVMQSLKYLAKLPPERKFTYGKETYTASELSSSLVDLYYFLLKDPSPEDLADYVRDNFDVYMSAGFDGYGTAMFTGYYTPELEARAAPDARFRYPLYRKPDDLVTAELALFSEKLAGSTIRGRVADSKLVPYYTRAEIDGLGVLTGRGLEVAWCDDPVDVFFLQVQGSGVLDFPDGARKHANFDSQNGRDYRSIGKLLVDEGKAELSEMSMDWLYGYLHEHPGEAARVLSHNESYVFFKLEDMGPYGSTGVPVTPERTIATDRKLFPEGALCFIITEAPDFDGEKGPVGWSRYSRFVMNQDTGGAIKGAGRADIYFGDDALAKRRAGYMRKFGAMYFLAGKR
ncbi:MAG TPA: MltA domain-containing protein [Nitrospirota bacterium]|jgi:membrane-bound lytic murein transglycosylase A